jgi:hypothetical protein
MLDEVLDHRLKAGQVALQQGLDNFVVKSYCRFCHRDHSFGLCFLIDYTVTEVPVVFCPSTDCRLFQTTFLQQFRGLIRHLDGFGKVFTHLFSVISAMDPRASITLDQDATFIETESKGALWNYQGNRSYEAFSTYCPEHTSYWPASTVTEMFHPDTCSLKSLKKYSRTFQRKLHRYPFEVTAQVTRQTFLGIAAKAGTAVLVLSPSQYPVP